jgi:hypothetical protein
MVGLEFEKALEQWEEKFEKDEWYFCNKREELVNRLTPEMAFNEIGQVVEVILRNHDDFVCIECFELLLSLARSSETTEMPTLLKEKWAALREHMSVFGEYQVNKIGELSYWYRNNAL